MVTSKVELFVAIAASSYLGLHSGSIVGFSTALRCTQTDSERWTTTDDALSWAVAGLLKLAKRTKCVSPCSDETLTREAYM